MSSPGVRRKSTTRQAYDNSAPSSMVVGRGSDPAFVVGDMSPTTSPSRSDFRLSATSCTSNINLMEKGDGTSGPPSMWNYPSFSELPTHLPQPPGDSGNTGSRGMRWAAIWQGWRIIVFGSWLNLLLFLIPVSWVLSSVLGEHHNLVFIFCTLSMIPLVKVSILKATLDWHIFE